MQFNYKKLGLNAAIVAAYFPVEWGFRRIYGLGRRLVMGLGKADISAALLEAHPKLAELHPTFATKVARIIERLEAQGWQPKIGQDGAWRTAATQRRLKGGGFSTVDFSFHMAKLPGGKPGALAVDLFDRRYSPSGSSASQMEFWRQLSVEAQKEGMTTGITWSNPWDPAHIQPWAPGSGKLAQVADGWTPQDKDFA